MTVILCVSEGGGILFGGRRVSRDSAVIEDISSLCGDGTLFVSEISESLFASSNVSVISATNPLESCQSGDFAFIEDKKISEYADKISSIIIYRWNRKYPFDFALDKEPSRLSMHLCESVDLVGKAHSKITREIWRKQL